MGLRVMIELYGGIEWNVKDILWGYEINANLRAGIVEKCCCFIYNKKEHCVEVELWHARMQSNMYWM